MKSWWFLVVEYVTDLRTRTTRDELTYKTVYEMDDKKRNLKDFDLKKIKDKVS